MLASMNETDIAAAQRELREQHPKLVQLLDSRRARRRRQKPSQSDPATSADQDVDFEARKLAWTRDAAQPGDSAPRAVLRFDFDGQLLSPERDVDVSAGLHHHGDQGSPCFSNRRSLSVSQADRFDPMQSHSIQSQCLQLGFAPLFSGAARLQCRRTRSSVSQQVQRRLARCCG